MHKVLIPYNVMYLGKKKKSDSKNERHINTEKWKSHGVRGSQKRMKMGVVIYIYIAGKRVGFVKGGNTYATRQRA